MLHKHYATIANLTSYADTGIGLAADPVGKYFESIEKILREIQETYKNTSHNEEARCWENNFTFNVASCLKSLNQYLKSDSLNKAMEIRRVYKNKKALGLSSSSITHKME
ncbi:hypothetical protein LNO89_04185 [Klebsiella pneumoniae subsp. pneumoniae]|nr:hypothetical protein [Klebsiella pneumoniae subsp. pneumoniae]